MSFERLTRTGSKNELTYEERDPIFEKMRLKAVGSINPIDLISIETNPELLDRNLNYNFDKTDSQLSPIVKNVIWALWENEEARKNLFPKNLLPKEGEDPSYAEERLKQFIDNKAQHQTPEGRALINFVILAIRSGFKAMPLKKRVEQHIAQQFEHFLTKYFDYWTALLKDKNRKFHPDQYSDDDERDEARKKFDKESKIRFKLIHETTNSEQLHSEIFSQFAEEGSMNVFGYFLRQFLNIKAIEVKTIMIEVIDKHFDLQRKKILELLEKTRIQTKEKVAKEKEINEEIDGLTDDVATKASASLPESDTKAAAHVTPTPGKVLTPSGIEIPVPERIERAPEPAVEAEEDDEYGGDFNGKEVSVPYGPFEGETTKVYKPDKKPISPTAYSQRPEEEVTEVRTNLSALNGSTNADVDPEEDEEILQSTLGAESEESEHASDEEVLHATDEDTADTDVEALLDEDLIEEEDDYADGAMPELEPEPASKPRATLFFSGLATGPKLSSADEPVATPSARKTPVPERDLKPVLKATTPRVVNQYVAKEDPAPEAAAEINTGQDKASTPITDVRAEGKCDVIPPIAGIALKTPQPEKLSPALQSKISQLKEQGKPKSAVAPAPIPAIADVKGVTEDITIPDLPSIKNISDPDGSIQRFRDLIKIIQNEAGKEISYMEAAKLAREKHPLEWEKAKKNLLKQKSVIEILAEENPETRMDRLKSWVAEHPRAVKAVIWGLVTIVVAGSGYFAYKQFKKDNLTGKDKIAFKSNDNSQKNRIIMAPTPAPSPTMEPTMGPATPPPMHTIMHTEPMRQAPMRQAMRVAPMRAEAMRTAPMQVATMKAPKEVMAASRDIAKAPIQRVKPVAPVARPATPQIDVKNAQPEAKIAYIDIKTINNLPDGTYKQMWEGKAFDVQDAPFSSISGFMEQQLKNTIKQLPSKKDRYKAIRAYYKELKQLERGWLIYMSMMEKDLQEKAMKGTLTAQEDAKLKYWEGYKKSHRARGWQAKWLAKRYESLMRSKKKGYEYYKGLYQRGVELMDGLAELNPNLDDPNNVRPGQKVVFANGKKVLKTFWRFGKAMGLSMPEEGMSTTGSIEPMPTHTQFAELNNEPEAPTQNTPDQPNSIYNSVPPSAPAAFGSAPAMDLTPVLENMLAKKPPRIPADARVYDIKPEDMFDVQMIKPNAFGAAEPVVLKPILAEMDRKRKQTPPPIPKDASYYKLTDDDIEELPSTPPAIPEDVRVPAYAEYRAESTATPPPIPEDAIVHEIKPEDMFDVKMAKPKAFGAAEEIILRPILADMDRKRKQTPPAIPADAMPSVYDIPRGDGPDTPPAYASISDNRMPNVTPPPIPAMADVPKEPKKKGWLGRIKSWAKEKLA